MPLKELYLSINTLSRIALKHTSLVEFYCVTLKAKALKQASFIF
jgi:hypothetical protein